jgi:leucyl aminopeptidase (aminopeptidase T)
MELQIVIDFTDEVLALLPQQRPPQLAFQASMVSLLQRGDRVRIEGISTDIPMQVAGRSWTLSQDECRLLIVIGPGVPAP